MFETIWTNACFLAEFQGRRLKFSTKTNGLEPKEAPKKKNWEKLDKEVDQATKDWRQMTIDRLAIDRKDNLPKMLRLLTIYDEEKVNSSNSDGMFLFKKFK